MFSIGVRTYLSAISPKGDEQSFGLVKVECSRKLRFTLSHSNNGHDCPRSHDLVI